MRILVCGTNYGSTYIRALAGGQDNIKVVGILSTGSAHSKAYAQQVEVPHYTSLNDFANGSIDIACVVVPGEAGHKLTLALLAKDIHVLCEHPIGVEQMNQALKAAQIHRRVFQVNAHFADLLAPQTFYQSLAVARQMGPALHYDIACNLRTLYSSLDLVGRALGSLKDIQVIPAPRISDAPAMFSNLQLVTPKVQISLLCQNFASAVDDGSTTLLNHRCSATFAHGNLLLSESNGPVMWFPTPVSMPPQQWRTYLPVEMNQMDLTQLQQQRDKANRNTIIDMIAAIQGQPLQQQQQPEYLQALASLWEQILHLLQPEVENL